MRLLSPAGEASFGEKLKKNDLSLGHVLGLGMQGALSKQLITSLSTSKNHSRRFPICCLGIIPKQLKNYFKLLVSEI